MQKETVSSSSPKTIKCTNETDNASNLDTLAYEHISFYKALCSHDSRFDGRFFVGVTSTGIYCRPICRTRTPKADNCRFFSNAASAEAHGFRPCLKCRPELAPGLAPIDARSRILGRATLLIEERGSSHTSVACLARLLNVSERHLRRVFEDEYGVSPVQYLQTRRLLLAKSLLTDTELPIGHVAKSAGFGSARRMTELFTKHYKLSPRDFRKQNSDTQSGLHSNVKSDLCSNVKSDLCSNVKSDLCSNVKFDLHSNVKSDLHSNVKPNSQQDVQSSAKSRKQLLDEHGITLLLGYRPPFNWQQLLSFLAGRTIAGVEAVCDNAYLRTVCIENAKGWIVIRHRDDKQALAVTISESLLPVLERVLARVRFLFDLNASPTAITNGLADFEALEPGLHINGIRVPGCFDAFEMAVRAILGQQITVKAAQTLAGRMASALGSPIKTPFSELNIIFPSASIIASIPEPVADTLGPLGITGNRCKCICALAHALQDGSLTLSLSCNVHEEMQKLSELPGFGPWTVQYVALRALGFSDAFPHTDYGVKKALEALAAKGRIAQEVAKNPKLIIELSRAWMPWRSYATLDLWHSLE